MLPTIAIRRTRPGVKDLEQKYLPRNGWIFLKHDQSFQESLSCFSFTELIQPPFIASQAISLIQKRTHASDGSSF